MPALTLQKTGCASTIRGVHFCFPLAPHPYERIRGKALSRGFQTMDQKRGARLSTIRAVHFCFPLAPHPRERIRGKKRPRTECLTTKMIGGDCEEKRLRASVVLQQDGLAADQWANYDPSFGTDFPHTPFKTVSKLFTIPKRTTKSYEQANSSLFRCMKWVSSLL